MTYNPDIHRRRSIRLKGYDYSREGAYFVTISTQHKECLFGEIRDGEMVLNEAGRMIEKLWIGLENRFQNFELGAFVVMPNHFHAIVVIENDDNLLSISKNVGVPLVGTQNGTVNNLSSALGQAQGTAPTNNQNKKTTVGDIIGAFKSLTTHEYIRNVKLGQFPGFDRRVWQRNYHEHIIRNEGSYEKIHDYILHNVERWGDDKFFMG